MKMVLARKIVLGPSRYLLEIRAASIGDTLKSVLSLLWARGRLGNV